MKPIGMRGRYEALLLAAALGAAQIPAGAAPPGSLYVTWEGSEPDKGASAWLIKRYIDRSATFLTKPHGSRLNEGIAFDVPESRFRRTHRFSTYETLLNEYRIRDPIARRMGVITHDIEINTWGKKRAWETPFVQSAVSELQLPYGEQPIPLDCYIAFFDVVYSQLRSNESDELSLEIPEACQPAHRPLGALD